MFAQSASRAAAPVAGVFPLAVATGAGAQSRIAIATAVMGGVITGTVLAIFLTPLFFVAISSLFGARKHPPAPPRPRTARPTRPEGPHRLVRRLVTLMTASPVYLHLDHFRSAAPPPTPAQ
jgi:hypothetical protein